MGRKVSDDALKAIAEREGLRLDAYQDQGGVWTIGYGHTSHVAPGGKITAEQALDLLRQDVASAEDDVTNAVKVSLTDNQYGALVSFDFNVGHGTPGVRDGFVVLKNGKPSTLLTKVNSGDFASVPAEMLKWVKVNGVRDDGLVNRRNSEGGQWVKGAYVRGASISPDAPVPQWKQLFKSMHAQLKIWGTMAAGSGISASKFDAAGHKLQDLGASWHVLAGVGLMLILAGVAVEFFKKDE